jgi:hypothetical protein
MGYADAHTEEPDCQLSACGKSRPVEQSGGSERLLSRDVG